MKQTCIIHQPVCLFVQTPAETFFLFIYILAFFNHKERKMERANIFWCNYINVLVIKCVRKIVKSEAEAEAGQCGSLSGTFFFFFFTCKNMSSHPLSMALAFLRFSLFYAPSVA